MSDNVKEELQKFADLIKKIETAIASPEIKHLWLMVYENAVYDRQLAYDGYLKLSNIMQTNSTEWAVHGRSLTGFIERMNKANDQLLRLSKQITEAETIDDDDSLDDLYGKIKQ